MFHESYLTDIFIEKDKILWPQNSKFIIIVQLTYYLCGLFCHSSTCWYLRKKNLSSIEGLLRGWYLSGHVHMHLLPHVITSSSEQFCKSRLPVFRDNETVA